MKKLNYGNIFNKDTLNIFTDASIKPNPDKTYTGCPGCICVTTNNNHNVQGDSFLENLPGVY